ncbi:glycosyltransferase family 4 protein [Alteromonas sp. CYL-A6]|uniref:glycosyltransferase family 4 protein n=1 Tax=Alteromonas nitratireducens TaxID=3390813 RepID=UPI0034A6F361
MSESSAARKIIHIVSSLKVGGAERFVIDLCQIQQKEGHKPAIFSLGASDDELVTESRSKNIPTYTVSRKRGWRFLKAYYLLRRASVIHVHSPHALKLLSPLLPLLSSRKIIYTRHGARSLSSKRWKMLHQFSRSYVSAVTFVSEEGRDIFVSEHKWTGMPVEVIDNGIDTDAMKSREAVRQTGRLRIGSVGRMVALKGQIHLLETLAAMSPDQRTGFDIHFYGDGPCREELTAYATQNLPDVPVTFHGMVSDREQIYNNIDVLCVTSETEGLSLAMIEAMSFERALLATNVGGNPRLVEPDINGILFEYGDKHALADALLKMAADRRRTMQMGQAGRQKVISQFSLRATSDRFEALYR